MLPWLRSMANGAAACRVDATRMSTDSFAALASVAPVKSAWVRISAPRAPLKPNKDANASIS